MNGHNHQNEPVKVNYLSIYSQFSHLYNGGKDQMEDHMKLL